MKDVIMKLIDNALEDKSRQKNCVSNKLICFPLDLCSDAISYLQELNVDFKSYSDRYESDRILKQVTLEL